MIRTDRRIPVLLTALATLVLAGAMLALHVSPAQAQGGSAPWPPQGLQIEASHDSVVLNWSHQRPNDVGGYAILRWDIDEQAPGFAMLEEDTGTTSTTYTDSSVEPNTRYIYQVKAINEHGTSPGSRNVYVVRTPADPATGTEPEQVEEGTATWIGIDFSPASIEQGSWGMATMAATGLEVSSGYNFTYDILDENGSNANICEDDGRHFGSLGLDTGHLTHFAYVARDRISKYCPIGSYSLHVVWSKYKEGVGYEYGGTVTKNFEVIPDSNTRTDFERVDYITPLYPDPPATHGPLIMGYVMSPSPSRANVGIGIGGLVPDSDPLTTDYVVSVRVVDEDNVPVEGCNLRELGGSFLIKIVPDSGMWSWNAGTLPQRCISGLRTELLNGSFEYLGHHSSGDVTTPRPPNANSPATGVPVIGGTPRVGETLTADTSGISDDDGLDNATHAYQWIRSDGTTDTEIAEATGTTYVVSADDVDSVLKVRVSFADDGGNDESLTSASTATVSATVPGVPGSVDLQPAGTGELSVSWEEPASDGGATVTGYTVQWKEAAGNWDSVSDVSTATTTGTSYTITSLSLGTEYSVRVIATNSAGDGPASAEVKETADAQTSQQQSANPNRPATGVPTISGTAQVGQTLTVDTSGIADGDGLSNVTYRYQWLAADAEIAGATGSSYTLAEADEGKAIRVKVSFTDDGENQESLTSEATETVGVSESHDRPHNLRATVAEGAITLTWQDPDTHPSRGLYHILRHRPELGEDESLVYVEYTPSADRTFTDSAVEPGVLYVYAVKAVKDPFGFLGPASAPVEVRMPPGEGGEAPNSPATGQPTISGTVQVGERLTADTSAIADADGLDNASFAYQWLADDSDIAGATGSTYTLDPGDEGKRVKVRVTFTDDAGNAESLTSAATNEVEARPNSPATGQPTIGGTAQVGETLTADTSGIADADGLSNVAYRYQWLAADAEIAGATGSSYTLAEADEGKTIRVKVSFTDDSGNSESLTSVATADVEAPLTAEIRNVPESHNGQNAFTFRILFSEPVTVGYQGLKEDSFEISNGTITRARRVNGRNDLRQFTVRPSSNLDVVIVLPADRPCDEEGAICTSDGKRLSNRLELTVPGPAPANAPATGAPTISGTAQVGQTLTATTSNIADSDGLVNAVYGYQWVRNDGGTDAEIQGATGLDLHA